MAVGGRGPRGKRQQSVRVAETASGSGSGSSRQGKVGHCEGEKKTGGQEQRAGQTTPGIITAAVRGMLSRAQHTAE